MFEEVAGLPAHPLLVHLPIVLVPLLIAVAVGYAVLPRLRRPFGWAVVVLAVTAPASVWLARSSGEAFEARLAARGFLPPELAARVDAHEALSQTLLWLTVALGAVSLLTVLVARLSLRSMSTGPHPGAGDDEVAARPRRPGMTVLMVLLALAVLGLSGAAGWYLVQTGDSGARMVWEGS